MKHSSFSNGRQEKNLSAVCGCCAVRTASAFNDGTRASAAGANRLRERQIMTQYTLISI